MFPRRLFRPVLPVCGAAALAGTAGLVPARGATVAGWQAVATVGQHTRFTYLLNPGGGSNGGDGFVVTGTNDAWSVWGSCAPSACGGKVTTIVERWNGSAWRRVAVPGLTGSPDAVAAHSATDAWLFTGAQRTAAALRWNGTAWTSTALPSWVIKFNLSGDVQIAAADFGPSDVWVFSLGQQSFNPTVPYAARFNGTSWVKVKLPAIPDEVSAVSKDDIWALGRPADLSGGQVLMHWDGTFWSTVTLPQVPPGDGTASFIEPSAGGPADLWLVQVIQQGTGPGTTSLEHWDGTDWNEIPLHFPASGLTDVADDGHGGLWMIFNGPKPALTTYFAHRTGGGAWTRTVVPTATGTTVQQASVITVAPGAAAPWAAGEVIVPGEVSGGIVGAIWRNGS